MIFSVDNINQLWLLSVVPKRKIHRRKFVKEHCLCSFKGSITVCYDDGLAKAQSTCFSFIPSMYRYSLVLSNIQHEKWLINIGTFNEQGKCCGLIFLRAVVVVVLLVIMAVYYCFSYYLLVCLSIVFFFC